MGFYFEATEAAVPFTDSVEYRPALYQTLGDHPLQKLRRTRELQWQRDGPGKEFTLDHIGLRYLT